MELLSQMSLPAVFSHADTVCLSSWVPTPSSCVLVGVEVPPSTLPRGQQPGDDTAAPAGLRPICGDMLQLWYPPRVSDICPIHRCINWLSENRSCATRYPSDIVSEWARFSAAAAAAQITTRRHHNHQRGQPPLSGMYPSNLSSSSDRVLRSGAAARSSRLLRQLTRCLFTAHSQPNRPPAWRHLHKKARPAAATATGRADTATALAEKQKKIGERRKVRWKKAFMLGLNYNSNRPCCNTNRNMQESFVGLNEMNTMEGKFTHTFTQEYATDSTKSEENDSDAFEHSNSSSSMSLPSNQTERDKMFLRQISKTDHSRRSQFDEFMEEEKERQMMQVVQVAPSVPIHCFKGVSLQNILEQRREKLRQSMISARNQDEVCGRSQVQVQSSEPEINDGSEYSGFLEQLRLAHGPEASVPPEYTCSYQFYLYFPPADADFSLLPFQRHELRRLTAFMDPYTVKNLCEATHADFLRDRRLRMIQIRSQSRLILEPLKLSRRINGLPHRLLTVRAASYDHIARALSIMEEALPELMRTAVFRTGLPSLASSCKWSGSNFILRPTWRHSRRHSSGGGSSTQPWHARIDPARRFPSTALWPASTMQRRESTVHSAGDNEEQAILKLHESAGEKKYSWQNSDGMEDSDRQLQIKTPSRELTRESITSIVNQSNLNCQGQQPAKTFISLEAASQLLGALSQPKNQRAIQQPLLCHSQKGNYRKRVRCPASLMKRFSPERIRAASKKHGCWIDRVDVLLKENQVKLSIDYNRKSDLVKFCNSLGLTRANGLAMIKDVEILKECK